MMSSTSDFERFVAQRTAIQRFVGYPLFVVNCNGGKLTSGTNIVFDAH
jgi:hypothetical protein